MTQVRLREPELLLVLAEVALDPRELLVREVVRVDRPLQVRVEPLDLRQDVARLSLLGRNRPRSGMRRRGSQKGRHNDGQPRQRLPTKAGGHALPGHDGRTGRGPVRHEHGTLTTPPDDRKRQGEPRRIRSRVVTVPPVGEPGTGLRAGLVTASVAILVALQLPAASGAGAPSLRERAQQLRSENATLAGEADAAWLSSVSLSTRLEQNRAALVRFRARTQEISAHRAEAEQTLRLARRTLKASQERARRSPPRDVRAGRRRPDGRARRGYVGRRSDHSDRRHAPDGAAGSRRHRRGQGREDAAGRGDAAARVAGGPGTGDRGGHRRNRGCARRSPPRAAGPVRLPPGAAELELGSRLVARVGGASSSPRFRHSPRTAAP